MKPHEPEVSEENLRLVATLFNNVRRDMLLKNEIRYVAVFRIDQTLLSIFIDIRTLA